MCTELTNIFYLRQYFLTVPYPERERKMAAGLAECFISGSLVLLRNMACTAQAQIIHKRPLNQLQADKQSGVNGNFAA